MIQKQITYCGQPAILACDGRCEKAWGASSRPKIGLDPEDDDDFAYYADDELGGAPEDPGTYEGCDGKPTVEAKLHSKWCARECERSVLVRPGEPIVLPSFERRLYNIHSKNTEPRSP